MVAQECRKLSNGTEWDLLCINGMQRDAVGQRQSPISYLCTVKRLEVGIIGNYWEAVGNRQSPLSYLCAECRKNIRIICVIDFLSIPLQQSIKGVNNDVLAHWRYY